MARSTPESGGGADVSWLCPRPDDRTRLRELERNTNVSRWLALGAMSAVIGWFAVAISPWLGLCLVLPWLSQAAGHGVTLRSARPERWILARTSLVQLSVAGVIVGTGGALSPATSWLALMPVTLCTRVGPRGLAVVMAETVLLAVGAFGLGDGHQVPTLSEQIVGQVGFLAALTALLISITRVESEQRSGRTRDTLTGALTRSALPERQRELERRLTGADRCSALILIDVDRFKAINDQHGHQRGDDVLRELAQRLEAVSRAEDLLFRIGGEEFAVTLLCQDLGELSGAAVRLRRAVEAAPVAGCDVTVSIGAALGPPGRFDYDSLFVVADGQLRQAKEGGRNAVRLACAG